MAFLHYPFLAILFFCITTTESVDPVGNFCGNVHQSNISADIGRVLAELESLSAKNGFSTTSYGEAKNRVYGMYQCRGDVSSKDCSTCIQDAAKEIRQRCPDQVDARIWYDFCFLRYNLKNFIGEVESSPGLLLYNVDFVPNPDLFNNKLAHLKNKITAEAIVTENKGLGKGKSKLSPFLTLYALAQCTRDLSEIDCAQCIAIAVGNFPDICKNRKGCRVLNSCCYVRYELYPFFFPIDAKEILANVSMNNYVKIFKP